MSEIKNSGIKGYALLGAFVAVLLFTILVIYLYKYNNYRVPEDPMLLGQQLRTVVTSVLA